MPSCNGIGAIHECGKRMLDSVDELLQPLQRPYLEYWTDEWNRYCHIVFLDGLRGILLCAEYDDDYCQKQGTAMIYLPFPPVPCAQVPGLHVLPAHPRQRFQNRGNP